MQLPWISLNLARQSGTPGYWSRDRSSRPCPEHPATAVLRDSAELGRLPCPDGFLIVLRTPPRLVLMLARLTGSAGTVGRSNPRVVRGVPPGRMVGWPT